MYYALLFLFLYLPFGVAINPAEGVDLASVRVFILIIFWSWLSAGLKNKKVELNINFRTALILSFLFLGTFSIFFSENTVWSGRKLLFLFSIFPLYFVSRSVINSGEKMEVASRTLVFGGLIVALVGIFQFLGQFFFGLEGVYAFWAKWIAPLFLGQNLATAVAKNPSWLVNISGKNYLRAVSTFPDPHMLSFYLGILAPISLGIFLKSKKLFYFGCFFVMILADFLTYSRGGYVGIFAGGIFLLVFFWKKISRKIRVALVVSAVSFLLVLFIPSPISERFLSSFDIREGSNQGRLIMWEKAAEVTLDNPFFGVGIGNYPLQVKPSANYRDPIYAHNTYLDISSETGIPNTIIFLALLVVSIFVSIKKAKGNFIYLGIALGLVIFSVHSVFETGIFSPAVLALFLIVVSFSDEKNI
jgi:O-antigen ligase